MIPPLVFDVLYTLVDFLPVHTIFSEHSIAMSHIVGDSTRALHADDALNVVSDVAPPMHLSTTFRYSNDPAALVPLSDQTSVCPF